MLPLPLMELLMNPCPPPTTNPRRSRWTRSVWNRRPDTSIRPLSPTARDITASRNAEYEHRIASEVMRTMSEAVAVLDWNHQFIAINEAFTRITG